jgi:DNA helicase HerA-like ATPase
LGVGEALVSVLDEKGTPTIVERALIYPPHSRLSPLNPEERTQFVHKSVLYGHYEKTVDRESAYEKLKAKAEQMKMDSQEQAAQKRRTAEPKSQTEQLLGAAVKSAAHAIGSQLGRQIIRGVLGSIFGGGRRR